MATSNEIPAMLPYPTRHIKVSGGVVEEYDIPEEEKQAVLTLLYPFFPVPHMDKVMIDIHANKCFRVRDFKVIQGPDRPFLMSPFWETSGGSVIDWFQPVRH